MKIEVIEEDNKYEVDTDLYNTYNIKDRKIHGVLMSERVSNAMNNIRTDRLALFMCNEMTFYAEVPDLVITTESFPEFFEYKPEFAKYAWFSVTEKRIRLYILNHLLNRIIK